MTKVLVLGGCGAVGSVAARTLVGHARIESVTIGDLREEQTRRLADELGPKASARRVDALDAGELRAALADCDLVLNCTGPFYRFVQPVLSAAIELSKPYVDVCDDVDVTEQILGWNERARRADMTALIGMGNSPGVTNLLALLAARDLLDQTDSIDIYHAHGGEPVEGPGVIAHRFHCMSIPVPVYLDGQLVTVDFFGPDGQALQEDVDFYRLGEAIRVYPYPHPEQLTLPRTIACRRVTNKGTVLPGEYHRLTLELARLGLADREPLEVAGQAVSPQDFAVAFLIRARERILRETRFGQQRGANKIVVRGTKAGKPQGYVFHLASQNQALGEGTGIPAAMGAILMADGKVLGPGVLPPEACVNPSDFLALLPEVMPVDSSGSGFDGVQVERIDEHGRAEPLDF
jgi:saccharopine dehydrogenase (NAD+, L-lysine-forming)